MRKLLIDKLIGLGFDSQLVSQKINEWDYFNNLSNKEMEDLTIELYIENKPTPEILKVFLNVNKNVKNVFVLDGFIEKKTIVSSIVNYLEVADFILDNPLCLLAITNDNKIKIVKYFPSDLLYVEKTYEEQYAKERENAINDYFLALTENSKLTREDAENILRVLISEFVIDEMVVNNLNPRIKIYPDAKDFAKNITSYNYKYINKTKNTIDEVIKEIKVKAIGNGVILGKITNNPYLHLDNVNRFANFYLDKPSYVWFLSNLKGKEELAIYSASINYSAKTYKEWVETREDIELKQKAEDLAEKFSSQIGYMVSSVEVFDVLKTLNRELVLIPTNFVKDNIPPTTDEIDIPSYHYSAITIPEEFEKDLYEKIEDYYAGTYRYQMVEKLKDNYTLLGKSMNYTTTTNETIVEQEFANFNENENSVVLKKVVLVTPDILSSIKSNPERLLPIPSQEVVFYFPSVLDEVADNVKLHREINQEVAKEKMTKVYISHVNKEGQTIKETIEMTAWIGENYTPQINYRITDKDGLMWEYSEMQIPTIFVKENERNEIVLVYDKLKRRVKINFIDELGNKIKDSQEAIYQVGEKIKLEENSTYIDPFGGRWKPKTLDKLNQKVFEQEEKNVINLIYEEETNEVLISFVNDAGQKVMGDKAEKVQIGSIFKYNYGKEIIDNIGKYWVCEEIPEEFEIKAEEEYKISIKCKPLISDVTVEYINTEEMEIMPNVHQEVQVGTKYIPKATHAYQGEDGRSWVVAPEQLKEYEIKKLAEENIIKVIYEPVLVNATIQYINNEGKEIKGKDVIPAQLGSKWIINPRTLIKDEKGNEYQLVENGYKPIIIKENEKDNVMTFVYQVAMANINIVYMSMEEEILKPDGKIIKQIGSAYVPTPEQYIIDKENRRWQLRKVQPAMLKVKPSENKVVITYQPDNVEVTWQYIDIDGNQLKENETHEAQVGEKYTPIVTETTLQRGGNNMKLLNIEPYEITISENSEENIVRLIYVKVTE